MLIEISTEPHIHGRRSLIERVYSLVEASVGRHAGRVNRVLVHLGEEGSSAEHAADADHVRCAIEVRLSGRSPRGVSHHARKIEDAVAGAVSKLARTVERTVGITATAR